MKEFNRYPMKHKILRRCHVLYGEQSYFSEKEFEKAENELIIESAKEVIKDANIDENLCDVLLWMLEK